MELLTSNPILLNIIIAVVSFGGGYITHWYVARRFKGIDRNTDTRTIITFVVLLLWASSVVFDMVSVTYETPFAIHGIFGAIVGFFYETSIKGMFNKK